MTNIEERITIAASPERTWGILADPVAAASYVPGIKAARMEGNTRICTMADGAEIRERIFDIAPAARSYRYEHTSTPMPVRLSRGRFHVASDGNGGSIVSIDAELEASDPAMETGLVNMMRGGLQATLANIKRLAEGER